MRPGRRNAVTVLVAFLVMAARSEPITTVQHEPVPPVVTRKLSDDQFTRLLADAAMQKGWRPQALAPGQIRARLTIRSKHFLTVDILYNRESYSIVVIGSEALNEGDGRIHPAANKAIRELQDAIQAALSREAF